MQVRSHRPQLNTDLCEPCGICRGACPGRIFPDLAKERDTLRSRLTTSIAGRDPADPPPCRAACPLGQDIPGYIRCLARGDQEAALGVILEHNPLPAVLGYVCHQPCQTACASAPVQRPPAIRELKRFASMAARPKAMLPEAKSEGRVAVVGSGPAGLAAAWSLARGGIEATLYEAQNVAGGMLAWAIPPFRLPRKALEEDIAYVLSHGVKLRLNRRLEPKDVIDFRKQNAYVILAGGAPRPRDVDLPGAGLDGVWLGLEFLRRYCLGPIPEVSGPVVVIGGGNVAIDSARCALRLGSKVILLYRRDREQMPAYSEEVDAALREGLDITFRAQPLALESGKEGRVGRIRYLETEPVDTREEGRQDFAPLRDRESVLPAKTVILALGQQSEAEAWASGLGLAGMKPDRSGLLGPGLYGAGDLITGPATVVEAMASGIACARSILSEITP